MQAQSFPPSPSQKHLIREFSYTIVQSMESQLHEHIAIDDGCYDFVFFNGPSANLSHGSEGDIKISKSVFTIHQLKPPFKFSFENKLELFVIKMQPWTNALCFPNSLAPGVIDLKSIYTNRIGKLYDNIFKASEINQKIALCESFINDLNIKEDSSFILIKEVCEKIYQTQGAIKVKELVGQFGINRQLLNKKFKLQVNYTIKQFIMIVRVMALVKYKIEHSQESLTTVAHHFNYTDQAHFNNDFKKVCGVALF